jgi:hypothetical protein
MSASDLPASTREFISRYIFSVEELEILMLLHGDPPRVWSVAGVYAVILSAPGSVKRWLDTLVRFGLLEAVPDEPPGFRYAATGALGAEVDELVAMYKLKPVRVIEAIFKRGPDPLQSFADSFKLNPPEE